jgi:hypothetical protein
LKIFSNILREVQINTRVPDNIHYFFSRKILRSITGEFSVFEHEGKAGACTIFGSIDGAAGLEVSAAAVTATVA